MKRFIVIFFLCLILPTVACGEMINTVNIRIEIDLMKQGTSKWDQSNIFGPEPDPYGKIIICNVEFPIELKNTYNIDMSFKNANMSIGDPITIDLKDKDRGRWDDDICSGTIHWNGEPQMEVRHGQTTIKLDFIM